jgi:hypothetical protein
MMRVGIKARTVGKRPLNTTKELKMPEKSIRRSYSEEGLETNGVKNRNVKFKRSVFVKKASLITD